MGNLHGTSNDGFGIVLGQGDGAGFQILSQRSPSRTRQLLVKSHTSDCPGGAGNGCVHWRGDHRDAANMVTFVHGIAVFPSKSDVLNPISEERWVLPF